MGGLNGTTLTPHRSLNRSCECKSALKKKVFLKWRNYGYDYAAGTYVSDMCTIQCHSGNGVPYNNNCQRAYSVCSSGSNPYRRCVSAYSGGGGTTVTSPPPPPNPSPPPIAAVQCSECLNNKTCGVCFIESDYCPVMTSSGTLELLFMSACVSTLIEY